MSWIKECTIFLNSVSSYLPKIPQKPEVTLFSLFGEMISEIISNIITFEYDIIMKKLKIPRAKKKLK